MNFQAAYQSILDDNRDEVIAVLAEFFQDSFKEDPHGVSDWLAQNGTSTDLFIGLVGRLRSSLPSKVDK